MSKNPSEVLDRYPLLYESLAVSETKWVQAVKQAATLLAALGIFEDDTWRDVHAKEEYVGKTVSVTGTLYGANMNPVPDKPIKVLNRVGEEEWSSLATPRTDANGNIKLNYILTREGRHEFYLEFEGDAEYEGCSKQLFAIARNFYFEKYFE